MNLIHKPLHAGIGAMILLMLAGCKSNAVDCPVKDREIVVDGDYGDWQNALNYFEDKDMSLGIMYDSTSLYLCALIQDDQLANQITGNGLSIWIDEKCGKNKHFGLKYPVGMMSIGRKMEYEGMERRPDESANGEMLRIPGDRAKRMDMMNHEGAMAMLQEINVLGDEEDRMSLSEAESFGIAAAFSQSEDYYILEIKIPLVISDITPYAIGEETFQKFTLGFITEQPDFKNAPGGRRGPDDGGMGGPPSGGGGPPGGGMGGGPGGGMGGPGGGPRGGQMQIPESLEFWIQANLITDSKS